MSSKATMITLTTDFGYSDPFVGIMKGVILSINPQVQIVDLSHGVPAQNIMAAGLVLQHSIRYFPSGTIHVVVVDPGVGTARRPILLELDGSYFIGPDNGVLSLALERKQPNHVIHLSNLDYQLQPTSATFHGRDIFAPVAANLSLGVPPTEFGQSLDTFVTLFMPQLVRGEKKVVGEVVYADQFGNLFTNIRDRDLKGMAKEQVRVSLGSVEVGGLMPHYAAVPAGEFSCMFNSWGLLEIAINQGNALQRTRIKLGEKVSVTVKEPS